MPEAKVIDTSKNEEVKLITDYKAGSSMNSIIVILTPQKHPKDLDGDDIIIPPENTYGVMRLVKKEYVLPADRKTDLYMLIGEYDDSKELKAQTEDLSVLNTAISDWVEKKLFSAKTKYNNFEEMLRKYLDVGELVDNKDGSYTFTAGTEYPGFYTLEYSMTDGQTVSDNCEIRCTAPILAGATMTATDENILSQYKDPEKYTISNVKLIGEGTQGTFSVDVPVPEALINKYIAVLSA